MTEAEDAALVWRCREEISRLEKEKEAAEGRLKRVTGERQAGNHVVSVSSTTRETVDGDKVRALLGEKTPVKVSVSVSLRVKYSPLDLQEAV